jgi:hypothetical protein
LTAGLQGVPRSLPRWGWSLSEEAVSLFKWAWSLFVEAVSLFGWV